MLGKHLGKFQFSVEKKKISTQKIHDHYFDSQNLSSETPLFIGMHKTPLCI